MHTFGRDDVRHALRAAQPIVALETAVLTHGLPHPINIETMRAMQATVRENGATPAAIGIIDGHLIVGLSDEQLEHLAASDDVAKASARDLAPIMARGGSAGLTVAGTLAVCRNLGVRIFATGGIGGVHRGWQSSADISADLAELAQCPCCVVCSGAKAILDIPATLEHLETLGVPVLGYQTDRFPQFYSRGSDEYRSAHRVDDVQQAARVCEIHWRRLRRTSAVLLANPVPEAAAIDQEEMDRAIHSAIDRAAAQDIRGQALTPFLLDAVADLTAGRSMRANLALLESNAALAARLAVAMAGG